MKLIKTAGKVVAVSSVAVGSAMAAVPAGVTTAMGDAATDAGTIAGLALIAVIAAAALKYARRGL